MHQQAQTIVALEKKFWQLMKDKDSKGAAALIADDGLVTGPQGVIRMTPAKYEEMTRDGKWTLDDYEFSEMDVVFAGEDVAVIAYKVHQTGTVGDDDMDMNCIDSSTWVRKGSEWKCALHTEIVLDGFPGA
jgi:ketosteroid isomerase-like protein